MFSGLSKVEQTFLLVHVHVSTTIHARVIFGFSTDIFDDVYSYMKIIKFCSDFLYCCII